MKIGIIGCGKIAQVRHIPEYIGNGNVEIIGYYDFNYQRAQKIAETFGGTAYENLDEMLENPSIDAVSVCTANHSHAEISIKALNAGKHVLCEKPMATTIEDCEAMVASAKENNKILMIDQNQRFTRAHEKAKELIEAGEIGNICTFRTCFGHGGPETWSVDQGTGSWFFDKKRAFMGSMGDLGVHKTDLIQYLLGCNVVETRAILTTRDKKDPSGNLVSVDDNAICIFTLADGTIGSMTASWTYYGEEDNSTVIYGAKGIMKIYQRPEYALEIIYRNGERAAYDLESIQTNDNQTKTGIIDEFVSAVCDNRSTSIDGESVLPAMRAVFASIKSSQEGRAIYIPENES